MFADFQINKEFIVANLCEQRNEQLNTCQGQCHLKKQQLNTHQKSNDEKSVQIDVEVEAHLNILAPVLEETAFYSSNTVRPVQVEIAISKFYSVGAPPPELV